MAKKTSPQPSVHGLNLRSVLSQSSASQFAWSPDGNLLAAPSGSGISVWDRHSTEPIASLTGHSQLIRAIAWSPDGKLLASASDDHTIRLWQFPAGAPLSTLEGHTKVVLSIAWSKDGRFIASGSYDDSLKIWDVKSASVAKSFETGWVYAADWASDGTLYFGDLTGHIYALDPNTSKLMRTFVGHTEPVYGLRLSRQGKCLATGSSDKTIRIWDVSRRQQTNVLEGCTGTVGEVCFSSDDQLFAATCRDSTVRLWRTDRWELVADLEGNASLFSGLEFHPNKPILSTVSPNFKEICIWDVDVDSLLVAEPATQSVRYTNAKVVLIGDTGVGKPG